jgi:hypothetical protein
MTSLSRIGRTLITAEFAIAVVAIVWAGFHDFRGVFVGAPPGLPIHVAGTCVGAESESSCHVVATELSAGRFRLATDCPATSLTVAFASPAVTEKAHHLLVGTTSAATVHLLAEAGRDAAAIGPIQLANAGQRSVIPLPAGAAVAAVTFSVAPTPASHDEAQSVSRAAPIVISEFGVFEDDRGLVSDVRSRFAAIPPLRYHATLVPRTIARLCFFAILAAFFVPGSWLEKLNPVMLAAVCFSLCLVDLAIQYSPYTGRDLRAYYAGGPLQQMAGNNLNGPIWEAMRLLQGRGFTVADGVVSWAKMPGYGLFSAVAGLLFGHRTLVDLVIGTVFLQVLFYSAALGFFAWAASRLWRPPVVWTVGVLVAMLPKQLGYTQVDSVIAPVALITLGALCLRLDADQAGRPVALGVDLFVHLTFALWFLMRPDVLPGWAIVSLILHARTPRRLLMPAALAALIGIGWAGYKLPYTGEFVPTTSTTGASLLCGLWEVPSRFPWVCSDDSYFAWVSTHTPFDPRSQAGSNVVVREVLRFWVTFPGHIVVMVADKIVRCFNGDLWSGISTDLQQSVFQVIGRGTIILFLVTTIALAVASGYQRSRTVLLAWPLLLNAPLFWIMQTSEGRYYSGAAVALLVGAVPLLFDRRFYQTLALRLRTTVLVLASVGILATAAFPIHNWLLRNDAFHYWTPFLNPTSSSWGVVK